MRIRVPDRRPFRRDGWGGGEIDHDLISDALPTGSRLPRMSWARSSHRCRGFGRPRRWAMLLMIGVFSPARTAPSGARASRPLFVPCLRPERAETHLDQVGRVGPSASRGESLGGRRPELVTACSRIMPQQRDEGPSRPIPPRVDVQTSSRPPRSQSFTVTNASHPSPGPNANPPYPRSNSPIEKNPMAQGSPPLSASATFSPGSWPEVSKERRAAQPYHEARRHREPRFLHGFSTSRGK